MSGSSLTVSVPTELLNSGFSRDHEHEVDAYAIALLRRSGHPTQAFAAMMRRLAKVAPESDAQGAAGHLSTHPPTSERIRTAGQTASGH